MNEQELINKKSKVKNDLQPRIFVADITSYVYEMQYGKWIDPTQGKETLLKAINEMLAESPVHVLYPDEVEEHFAIHNYEDFYEAELNEYPNLGELAERASFILKHGRLGAALIGYCGSVEEAKEAIENKYCGQYESVKTYVYELLTQQILGKIPKRVLCYLDFEACACDLESGGDIFTIKLEENEVHIFKGWNWKV